MKERIESNIWKYYLFSFTVRAFMFYPVLVLFFQENGLSMAEILFLQSVYAIAIVVLEVPTGAVGDWLGKKESVCIGSLIFALGLFFYSVFSGFLLFLTAEILCGIGASLMSGSDSALLHGSLKMLGREREFKKIQGRANSLQHLGTLIFGIIGGIVARYSLRMTMAGSALMAFITFIAALFIVEPRGKMKERERYGSIIRDSFKIIGRNKLVLWIVFYSSILFALTHIIAWGFQPYFKMAGFSIEWFGFLYAGLSAVAVIASRFTHEIEGFFGNRGSLLLLSGLGIVSALVPGQMLSVFAVVFFGFHQVFHGIAKTIFYDRILNVIPGSRAATVLSISNLGRRFFYAGLGPVFGYLTDVYDVQCMLTALGVSILGVTVLMFIIYAFIPERFHGMKEGDVESFSDKVKFRRKRVGV